MKTTFKQIKIGSKFQFHNGVEFDIGKTYRKTSARGYRIVGDQSILGGDYKVGSINVECVSVS